MSMGLDNLVGMSLERIEPNKNSIGKLLDAAKRIRKQRNNADYSGNMIPESAVKECIELAERLFKHVKDWLRNYKPDLSA